MTRNVQRRAHSNKRQAAWLRVLSTSIVATKGSTSAPFLLYSPSTRQKGYVSLTRSRRPPSDFFLCSTAHRRTRRWPFKNAFVVKERLRKATLQLAIDWKRLLSLGEPSTTMLMPVSPIDHCGTATKELDRWFFLLVGHLWEKVESRAPKRIFIHLQAIHFSVSVQTVVAHTLSSFSAVSLP